MARRYFSAGMLVLMTLMANPAAAEGTLTAALRRQCPEANTGFQLANKADEDRAVDDADAYGLSRTAARHFYHCSTVVADPQVRDQALLEYVIAMHFSTRTNGDVLNINPQLDSVLNDIAYASTNAEIRTQAKTLRRLTRTEYRNAYKAVNGEYPADAPDLAGGPAQQANPFDAASPSPSPEPAASPP